MLFRSAAHRPVLLFSHGHGGCRWQSVFWTEWMATHGWIVVAPDHVYDTYFDEDDSLTFELALRRPLDIRDSFDWLTATDGDGRLTGCVDADAGYVMSGHSFGAYTTLAVTGAVIDLTHADEICDKSGGWMCPYLPDWEAAHPDVTSVDLSDPRASAGVAMCPAAYEILAAGLPQMTHPTLIWGGTRDTLTPLYTSVKPIWNDVGARPDDLAVLQDAGHYTFSDACDLLPTFPDCADPYLDPAVAHPIVDTVSYAFLQAAQGRADADQWLPPADQPLLDWKSQ